MVTVPQAAGLSLGLGEIIAFFEAQQFKAEQEARIAETNRGFDQRRDNLIGGQTIGGSERFENPLTGGFGIPEGATSSHTVTPFSINGERVEQTRIPGLHEISQAGLEDTDRISQLARQRVRQGQSLLEGLGDQAKEDTRRQFDAATEAEVIDLANRGFGGSLAVNARLGGLREREDAVARIDEAVRLQQANTFAALSGDQLQTESGLLGLRHEFRGLPTRALDELSQQKLAFNAGRTELPPGPNAAQSISEALFNFSTSQKQISRGAPSGNLAANTADVLTGVGAATTGTAALLGAGGAATTGAVAAKAFIFCVDGEAGITTDDTPLTLAEIQIGDRVLGSDDRLHVVIDKDYGLPLMERGDDFIRVTDIDTGKTLVITKDHEVGGIPAEQWAEDEGYLIEPNPPVLCGDLHLQGGHGYYANGFRVDSMLAKIAKSAELITA